MISKHIPIGAAVVASIAFGTRASAQINLTAGDVAIIGWVDNAAPADTLTIVALADLPAGTTLYFTDNGWAGTGFRNTVADGDGNEQLLRFVVNNPIAAGTIVSTTDAGADFTWSTAVAIPGAIGNFSIPVLAQTGDQVYAFQHDTVTDPLNTPMHEHVFLLDDTGTFEPATSAQQGEVPPGLSALAGTALTFAQSGSGQNFMAFNTSTLANGTKSDWLTAIASASNWTFGGSGTLPSGTIAVNGPNAPVPYCFGDGTGTACPCSPAPVPHGAPGKGCPTNAFPDGASATASGVASLASDSLVLSAADMINGSMIFYQGATQQSGGAGLVFGDGLRCIHPSGIRRFKTRAVVGNVASYPQAGDANVSIAGAIAAPGVFHYQGWYRSANPTFCTVATYNLTNGVSVTWGP